MISRSFDRFFKFSIVCVFFLFSTQTLVSQEIEFLDCEGEWADSQLCKEREEAFEFKARVDLVLEDLPQLESPPWNTNQHKTALSDYETAMDYYNDAYFGDASTVFESVLDSLLSLKSEFEESTAKTEELAFSLLEEDRYSEAIPHLQNLELWMPSSSRVSEGVIHARHGIELEKLVIRMEELIENHAYQDVEAELADFPAGYWQKRVSALRLRVSNFRHEQSFNALMSRGLEDLDASRWQSAHDSFEAALKLSPHSVVAKESLDQARAHITKTNLATLLETLSNQESAEQWEEMLQTLAAIEQWSASEEIEASKLRVKHLLSTETQLTEAISKASTPMSKQVRSEIQALIASTEELDIHDRISLQRSLLKEEFDRNTKRVSITVISDGETNVLIRPGQTLGKFSKVTLSVYPGTYDFIGRRKGYHETREAITIEPDSSEVEVRIVCDVRF